MKKRDYYEAESYLPDPAREPCLMLLFGGAGDLAHKKILPALYNLAADKLLPEQFAVLAVARTARDDQAYRQIVRQAVQEHSRRAPAAETLDWLLQRCFYQPFHADSADDRGAFQKRLAELDDRFGAAGHRLFYLATAPEAYLSLFEAMIEAGAASCGSGGPYRVVVEKPFGVDLESARTLNRAFTRCFDESCVYRVDHFLGKETVQNLVVFRFANAVFDPLFNHRLVHDVQITVAETDGIAGRGGYYDQAGALKDMVQNHLLQLLALTAMEPPAHLEGESIRDRKVELLQAVRVPTDRPPEEWVVRGQYAAGAGQAGYRQEDGIDPASNTESYVALRLAVENKRWSGVPFYLRTGKRLASRTGQIVLTFRHEAHHIFGPKLCNWRSPNRLIFRIQPDEGIALAFDAKVPGQQKLLRPVQMDLSYERTFETPGPEAYEHLLLDALRGERSPFTRADEVEASWRIVDAVQDAWRRTGRPGLDLYPAGSWGPDGTTGIFTDQETNWQTR